MTIACDSTPLLAPTESSIIIVADRLILPVNGEATITATVIEQSGTAVHNGTLVTFSTSLGVLEPSEARTSNGKVAVKLRAGTESGTAVISAFSGGASATGEGSVSIQIGAAAASAIVLSVSPGSVPSAGGTVNVTAAVTDVSGNRLPGVPVSFSADVGTLGSTSVVTDSLGEAKTTLTTNRESVVSASAGAVAAVSFTVRANTAPSASLGVTTTSPVVGQATVFSVTVTAGSSTITGVTMNFGDGKTQPLGATAGTSTVSHIYSLVGTYIASVTVTDAGREEVTGSAVIVVKAAPPINVNLTASPSRAAVGEVVTFTATASGSAVPIDRYEWNLGDSTTATTSGSAITHVYSTAGTLTVTVRAVNTDGVSGSTSAIVIVTAAPPINVNLTASPSPATVDEVVTFTTTASGSTVPIDRYEWTLGDGTVATTSGSTLTHVYDAAGTVTVTVNAVNTDGVSGSTQMALVVEPSQFSINLTFSPGTPTTSTTITFTATVTPTTTVIDRYVWDFGDGTAPVTTSGNTTSKILSLGVPSPGSKTFIVKVTAFKAIDGSSVSTEASVTVTG